MQSSTAPLRSAAGPWPRGPRRAQGSDPDAALLAACRAGAKGDRDAQEALGALYERHSARVYSICYRTLRHEADALDAMQEAFLIVLCRIESFRGLSRFSSWLYTVARNVCLDKRRSARLRPVVTADLFAQDGESLLASPRSSPPPAPHLCAQWSEVSERLRDALLRLSPKLRAVAALRYLQHLSYDEIAARLGIPVGTAKSRLARARDGLAVELLRRPVAPRREGAA